MTMTSAEFRAIRRQFQSPLIGASVMTLGCSWFFLLQEIKFQSPLIGASVMTEVLGISNVSDTLCFNPL